MDRIRQMKKQSGSVLLGVLLASVLVLVALLAIIYREITRTPERTVMQQQSASQAVEILSPDGKMNVNAGEILGIQPETVNEPVGMAGTNLDNRVLQSGSMQAKPKLEKATEGEESEIKPVKPAAEVLEIEISESEVNKVAENKRGIKTETISIETVKPETLTAKPEATPKEKAKPAKKSDFDEEADLF